MKLIIEGKTGCGKTYHAINKAKNIGTFAYMAPCRQLAYEIYIDYSTEVDHLSTGEVKIGNSVGDFYGVYESLRQDMISRYDTIIIDEAHFITDEDRGGHLVELINEAKKQNKNIFLVTATRNFRKLRNFDLVQLMPRQKPPRKKRVSWEEFNKRVSEGIPTIHFVKYKSDIYHLVDEYREKGIACAGISADTTPAERLEIQMQYRAGLLTCVVSTNVLAQGINMPCENLFVEYNPWDGVELIEQKIGRLGRMGFCDADYVTYCASPAKVKKNKKIKKSKREKNQNSIYLTEPMEYEAHEEPCIDDYIAYRDVRYSYSFIGRALDMSIVKKEFLEYFKEAKKILTEEQEKIIKEIKKWKNHFNKKRETKLSL